MGIVCDCVCPSMKQLENPNLTEGDDENDKRSEPRNIIFDEDEDEERERSISGNDKLEINSSSKYFKQKSLTGLSDTIFIEDSQFVEIIEDESFKQNYLKVKRIGKGGYGEVWKAKNKILDKDCAMKIIERGTERIKDSEIENEINILKTLDHPNIEKIYDVYKTKESFFLITEFCPQGNLNEELIKRGLAFKEAECAFIIKQILMAMNYYHKMRIIHRDIKPENIMISKREDNGCFHIKIIDFGVAAIYSGKNEETIIGTPYATAPEVIKKNYDERCDIWSLGITMYILLTGDLPFNSLTLKEYLDEVLTGEYNKKSYLYRRLSVNAKDLLESLLTVDPDERISVEEALNHEWFKTAEFEDTSKIIKIEPEMAQQLLENISKYKKENKLKCAAIAYLVHNNTNLSPLVEASKLFQEIDVEHSGKISYEKLKKGLKKFWGLKGKEVKAKAKEIFHNLDIDHSGFIEYEEFVRAAVNPKIFLQQNYLKFAFNFFDEDKSGDISLEELKHKFIKTSEKGEKVIETQIKNLLEKIKVDENEKVTLEIFSQIMYNILNY